MPDSAARATQVDHAVAVEDMAGMLAAIVREDVPEPTMAAEPRDDGEASAAPVRSQVRPGGDPSPYVCPDCGGVLWERPDGPSTHFQCRVGHAYSEESLVAKNGVGVEDALWTALRALDE